MTEHLFDVIPPELVAVPDPDGWDELAFRLTQTRVPGGAAADSSPDAVPADLDGWQPGLFSAAVLSSVDRSRLSADDLVTVLRAEERLVSHLQARQAETIAALAHSEELGGDFELASAEIGAALHLTRRAADTRLATALGLTEGHPQVGTALTRGEIDLYRARVILDAVLPVDGEAAERIIGRVLTRAAQLTAGQLRAWLRRLVAEEDPDGMKERHQRRVEERTVVATPSEDGTADLCGYDLPAHRVAEARAYIEALARHLPANDRTIDQRRADVFLDLLSGVPVTATAPARGVVDITIDLETLAGLAEHPAQIPGFGPIIADVARRLAHEYGRQWQITVTHHDRSLWCGVTRRRPDTDTARRIRASWPRCVFPGCRMPARACDLDHTYPWAQGGATCEHNLLPLCRHHHTLRHRGWNYRRHYDHTVVWTSPLGRTYRTHHPP